MNIKIRIVVAIVFGASAVISPSRAAIFNCAKAGTNIEKTICSDIYLSNLDIALGHAYQSALSFSKDKKSLKESQRDWVVNVRDKSEVSELEHTYESRIHFLLKLTPANSSDLLADLEGTYLVESASCSQLNSDQLLDSCSPTTADCLSIRRDSKNQAFISIVSYQTNGHICSAEGTAMATKDGMFEITEIEGGYPDISKQPITIKASSDPMFVDGPDTTCGARALWRNVAFSRKNRIKREFISCQDYNNPDLELPQK